MRPEAESDGRPTPSLVLCVRVLATGHSFTPQRMRFVERSLWHAKGGLAPILIRGGERMPILFVNSRNGSRMLAWVTSNWAARALEGSVASDAKPLGGTMVAVSAPLAHAQVVEIASVDCIWELEFAMGVRDEKSTFSTPRNPIVNQIACSRTTPFRAIQKTPEEGVPSHHNRFSAFQRRNNNHVPLKWHTTKVRATASSSKLRLIACLRLEGNCKLERSRQSSTRGATNYDQGTRAHHWQQYS
jgi:hypothetical protein